MAKSPGFWFFTGDWMKDPELRFCSIFARGLLADLLCILFEAKERGYASNPDGTARSDREIVDAISGGSRDEKLAGLAELERSGALSRDERGVLFSRRLSRLGELSKTRSKAGSKGGSKRQANTKQNDKQTPSKTEANVNQNDKQNRGVPDSVSVSVTDTGHAPFGRVSSAATTEREGGEDIQGIWETFRQAWNKTPNTKPWNGFGCPTDAFEVVTDLSFARDYPAALERLGASKFFADPAALTWFLRNWHRVLAGEFDGRIERAGKPKRKIFTLDDEEVAT
ncbi:MAG: hypothetical protein WCH40_06915 [Verrucomicrobiales bacterium]